MGLTMREKKAVVEAIGNRFRKGSKKEKQLILDEFTRTTRYNRSYASYLLRGCGKRVRVGGLTLVGVAGGRRVRQAWRVYDQKVINALKQVWTILDYTSLIGECLPKAL
jgi:hypothetical protein